ncbi:hypothetical protein BDB13_3795 [Rhodococcus sp. OK302]|nr:hypothetical protein BDB13_3795 [Rhodococcus sp. OK302]
MFRYVSGTPHWRGAVHTATNWLPRLASSETFSFAGKCRQLLTHRNELGSIGTFRDRSRDIFRSAAHFEHPINEFGCLAGRQDDSVSGNCGAFHSTTLLIRALTARLAAVPPPTSDSDRRNRTTAPDAGIPGASRSHAGRHVCTLYSRFGGPQCARAVPGKMGRLRLLATREPIGDSWRCR